MMKRAILSVALAIAFMAGVSAQDKPNFAGTWKAAGSFNSWTITVEGSKMTVTMTVAGNSESTVYMLDGTPSTKTMEGPNGPVENVYTSTWEGDVLVTTITAPGHDPRREALDRGRRHDEGPNHPHHDARQACAAAAARGRGRAGVEEGRGGALISRREFLGTSLGAGAALALTPGAAPRPSAVGWNAHSAGHSVDRRDAPGCSPRPRTATRSSHERTRRGTKRCAGIRSRSPRCGRIPPSQAARSSSRTSTR